MEFCELCGSLMNAMRDGLRCPNCGWSKLTHIDMIQVQSGPKKEPEPVYVAGLEEDSITVQRACPKCRNPEAYKTITITIGEHAGVNNDRSIQRFKCTECHYAWIEG